MIVDIDVDDALREVFLNEFWIPAIGRSGNLDWINVEETDIVYGGSTIGIIVQFYSDFISKRLATPGIVYSQARRGFVSKTGLSFR